MVTVTTHTEIPSIYGDQTKYRRYQFVILTEWRTLLVQSEGGEYEYEDSNIPEDDEPIQIAIGQYMAEHNIDPGTISR